MAPTRTILSKIDSDGKKGSYQHLSPWVESLLFSATLADPLRLLVKAFSTSFQVE